MAFRSLFVKDPEGNTTFNPAAFADMGVPKPDAIYSICGDWFAFVKGTEYGPFTSYNNAFVAAKVKGAKL